MYAIFRWSLQQSMLLAVSMRFLGSGNGSPNRSRLVDDLAGFFNQSKKPFCIGAPNLLTSRTTNHRTRRASDRRRSREQKAQCLELESVPLASLEPGSFSVSSKRIWRIIDNRTNHGTSPSQFHRQIGSR
jgi:hypothetical protein